jgi:hypothetical protein
MKEFFKCIGIAMCAPIALAMVFAFFLFCAVARTSPVDYQTHYRKETGC